MQRHSLFFHFQHTAVRPCLVIQKVLMGKTVKLKAHYLCMINQLEDPFLCNHDEYMINPKWKRINFNYQTSGRELHYV